MGLPNIFQPKWKLFRRYHERLKRPNPVEAQQKFERRLFQCRRVGMIRSAFLAGLYFSFIAAATSFLLEYFNIAEYGVLDVLQTVSSSLTVVFVAGVFVCSRYLGYLEVEMTYLSMETQLEA